MHDPAYTDALADRLTAALSTIHEHWEGMTVRPAIRPRVGRRPAPQSTPPVGAGITTTRALAHTRLHQVAHILLEEHPDTDRPAPDSDAPTLAWWLWEHVDTLAGCVTAGDVDELEASARQVLHHSAPTRPDWMRIGACPLLMEDGSTCGGEVRGWPHHTDEAGSAWCRCEACGTQAVASWWEAQGMGATGGVLTTDEVRALAHKEFGVTLTSQAVRMWVNRGVVRPIQPGARPLTFHRSDVVRHLAASG